MATLSGADQKLSASDQKKIQAYKDAYANATTQAERDAAHAGAEAIRLSAGYSGGDYGNSYTPVGADTGKKTATHDSGYKGSNEVRGIDTSSLDSADKAFLSWDDQQSIAKLKNAYAAATDPTMKEYINSLAEGIRANSGYTLGKTGSDFSVLPYGQGGRSATEMAQALDDYRAANTNYGSPKYAGQMAGWTNGYSAAMNVRSMANMVRQQMEANSKAWATADEPTRKLLHEQNLELAKLINKRKENPETYENKDDLITYYDPESGEWYTYNTNVGYGKNANWLRQDIVNDLKRFYGYTDEDFEKWNNDTSHYYNFVDTRVGARNTKDESSGYTGAYAQFVNGPYANLRFGTMNEPDVSLYTDVYGDGFGMEDYMAKIQYDANGNVIKTAPELKNNNNMSVYGAQFSPMASNGVLGNQGAATPLATASDSNNTAGQAAYYSNYGAASPMRISLGSTDGFTGYLQQIYADALQAQLKALESGYVQNISELDASQKEIDGLYKEQKRQVSGQSAQNSAAWREVANAYGLGSGAVGQASLAQRNQLQSDLNKLNAAQASARTEIQRQRLLLGQQYQLAIEQAVAENNGSLAKSLYEEAVRAEESLKQQEQFYANLALQYGKSMMSFAKSAGSGLSRVDEYNIIEDAVKNGYINDTQAVALLEMFGLA